MLATEGKNKVLDAVFKTGLANPAWKVGLMSGDDPPEFSADDTLASHVGWVEFTSYSDEGRQAFTPGEVSEAAVDNVDAKAVFHLNATGKVAGFFITDAASGTGGVLIGAVLFDSGIKDVDDGDILHITVTFSE